MELNVYCYFTFPVSNLAYLEECTNFMESQGGTLDAVTVFDRTSAKIGPKCVLLEFKFLYPEGSKFPYRGNK